MFCPECGKKLETTARFCQECGTAVSQLNEPQVQQAAEKTVTFQQEPPVYNQAPQQPYGVSSQAQQTYSYQQPEYNQYEAEQQEEPTTFINSIKLFFINYTNFSGRTTKKEYWWAFLFQFIVSMVLTPISYIGPLISLALLIPGIAINVRRLHDVGKKGTYLFVALIPVAGIILLLIQYCKDSDEDNQWGPRR